MSLRERLAYMIATILGRHRPAPGKKPRRRGPPGDGALVPAAPSKTPPLEDAVRLPLPDAEEP